MTDPYRYGPAIYEDGEYSCPMMEQYPEGDYIHIESYNKAMAEAKKTREAMQITIEALVAEVSRLSNVIKGGGQ